MRSDVQVEMEAQFSKRPLLAADQAQAQAPEQIHQRALEVSRRFKACEQELQSVLRQVDEKRVYLHFGHSSLFRYAVDALGLSPDVAYNHISVARKSSELPALKAAIDEGEITVSQARHITSVITPENQSKLLDLAKNCTREEVKKEVARIAPEKETKPEKARYVSEERLALELRVSEKLMKKLRRAQDLVSQSERKLASLEETLEQMVECFLEKKDPMRRAQRVVEKKCKEKLSAETGTGVGAKVGTEAGVKTTEKKKSQAHDADGRNAAMGLFEEPELLTQNTCTVQVDPATRQAEAPLRTGRAHVKTSISALVQHAVRTRDQGRCTEITPAGKRCSETRWLHFHHIVPVANGGGNEVANLRLLCSGHHRGLHFREKKRVGRWVESSSGPWRHGQ